MNPTDIQVTSANITAIDLIARLGDAFEYDDIEWETITISGLAVRVATPRMLFEMKRDTVRTQDRSDAETLRTNFDVAGE